MNGGGGPGAGQIIAGIFLILLGLCVTLLGGGCTVLMLSVVVQNPSAGGIPFLLISVTILAAGLASLWAGIMLIRGRI
jgi:hypothetical protein